MKPKLSIVLTAYNESKIIEAVLTELNNEIGKKIPSVFIVAEDGSTDNTRAILRRLQKKLPLKLVLGKEKKGFKKASMDALKAAETPLIFFTDSDGQYHIPDFWKLYRNIDSYDIVHGRKVNRKDPWFRRFLSDGFNVMVRMMFKTHLLDVDSGFKLIRKKVIDDVLEEVKYLKYGFTAEFNIRALYKGYKINEVPIQHHARRYGKTGMFPTKKLPAVVIRMTKDLFKLRKELVK